MKLTYTFIQYRHICRAGGKIHICLLSMWECETILFWWSFFFFNTELDHQITLWFSVLVRVKFLFGIIIFPPLGDKSMFKDEVNYFLCCFYAKVQLFTHAMTITLAIVNIIQIVLPLKRLSICSSFWFICKSKFHLHIVNCKPGASLWPMIEGFLRWMCHIFNMTYVCF